MPVGGVMRLTKNERMELQRQAGARNGRADSARHARLILSLADGLTWAEIRAKLDCSDSYIDRWSKRFAADRLAGLFARHAGRERYKVTDRIEARVLAWTTKHKPADGSTHWSSRKLASELGDISHMTVSRIWAKHGIKPHRLEGYLASNDPDFERKAADLIGHWLSGRIRSGHIKSNRGAPIGAPLFKSQKSPFRKRNHCLFCDHHVVQNPNVNQSERLFQRARKQFIRPRRLGDAAGVAVRKDHCRAVLRECPLHNFSRVHRRLVERSAEYFFARNETILGVKIQHGEALVLPSAEKQTQVVAHGGGVGKNVVPSHFLGQHPSYQFARSEQLLAPTKLRLG
jgi:transposase